MEKEVACEQLPPHAREEDGSIGVHRDGELGLGAVDIERVERVYRY